MERGFGENFGNWTDRSFPCNPADHIRMTLRRLHLLEAKVNISSQLQIPASAVHTKRIALLVSSDKSSHSDDVLGLPQGSIHF